MSMHVMTDIEAMSLSPTAAITSIGAVMFDPHGDWIGDTFYIDISLADVIRLGFDVEAETVLWWMRQDDGARHALISGQYEAAPLHVALEQFAVWLPDDAVLWAKQASYDIAAIRHAYMRMYHAAPWNHRNEACMRRMLETYRGPQLPDNPGRAHHALDDAIYQARLVQQINAYSLEHA